MLQIHSLFIRVVEDVRTCIIKKSINGWKIEIEWVNRDNEEIVAAGGLLRKIKLNSKKEDLELGFVGHKKKPHGVFEQIFTAFLLVIGSFSLTTKLDLHCHTFVDKL